MGQSMTRAATEKMEAALTMAVLSLMVRVGLCSRQMVEKERK